MHVKNTFISKQNVAKHQEAEIDHEIDIILVGNRRVGKTSVLFQYTSKIYSELYFPTIGIDFKSKIIETLDGQKVQVKIWDTCRYYIKISVHLCKKIIFLERNNANVNIFSVSFCRVMLNQHFLEF